MNEDRRCLIVDCHPVVRLGVRELLGPAFDVEEACDWPEARDVLTATGNFDVAVIDIDRTRTGDLAGSALIRAMHRERPSMGIVAHARRAERLAASEALGAGASAFVAKSSPPEALRSAVEAAAGRARYVDPAARRRTGGALSPLTRRQREILQLLADGHSTASAADRLGLSGETIRTHTKAVLARLEARDRAHAVAIGLRTALID